MFTIEERFNQEIEAELKIKNFLKEGKITSLKNACDILWYKYEIFAVRNYLSKEVKQFFFVCGLLNEYSLSKFNERFFDNGLSRISYAILSDNETLIQRYAKLRYQKGENAILSMDEMVAQGESAIWCNTVQFFIENNKDGIEKNLNIIETKTLKNLPKKEKALIDDYEFYKALHHNNKSKMEEILEKLTSPKIHKQRNDNPILNQYISIPALGYAKLAWRKGVEVEVKSNLVPKDMLPIQPLEKYEVPYDFLKEI